MKKLLPILLFVLVSTLGFSQDQITVGTGLGQQKVRLAVPEFKPVSGDAQTAALNKVFNDTLWCRRASTRCRFPVSRRK